VVRRYKRSSDAPHQKSICCCIRTNVVFNVNNISAVKHIVFGATSRYNVMLFHVARRYNVILQRMPHFLITTHQKSAIKTVKTFFQILRANAP
jgi:hypothetical protein